MNNRRKFISTAGLAIAGITVTGLQGQSLVSRRSPAEREVFRIISRYGAAESVRRSPGSGGEVTITVRMHSPEALAETFTGSRVLPFGKIRATGNSLRFHHRGTEFHLENLA
jgi:hypothetical protein